MISPKWIHEYETLIIPILQMIYLNINFFSLCIVCCELFLSRRAVRVCLCHFHLGGGGVLSFCCVVSVRVLLHVVFTRLLSGCWHAVSSGERENAWIVIFFTHTHTHNKSQSMRPLCLTAFGTGKSFPDSSLKLMEVWSFHLTNKLSSGGNHIMRRCRFF